MQDLRSESPAECAGLSARSLSATAIEDNESGDSFYGRGTMIRNQPALFMPTTPFREGYVCSLSGQVFWLSDRPKPAPSRQKRLRSLKTGMTFPQWIIAGSVPDYSGGTATEFCCQRNSHRLPFSLAPVFSTSTTEGENTREHPNSVHRTDMRSTRRSLITDNLNATPVRHVDSLSRNRRIRCLSARFIFQYTPSAGFARNPK